jgi:Phosphoglucomutase/phosphomannomutase, alpha/beta/alpha domain I
MRLTEGCVVTSTLLLRFAASPVQGWNIIPLQQRTTTSSSRPSSQTSQLKASQNNVDDNTAQSSSFVTKSFVASSECDNINTPPSLQVISSSLKQLTVHSSDIRGRFVDHAALGSLASVAHAIQKASTTAGSQPPLTPFAAYCLGNALAKQLLSDKSHTNNTPITIAVGMDPRPHGMRLADALARGAESATSADDTVVRVVFTGIATTPACAAFVRMRKCDAAVVCAYCTVLTHPTIDFTQRLICCWCSCRLD